MPVEDNVYLDSRTRGENIIKHPPESYAEVSVRSIFKIRQANEKVKNNKPIKLERVSFSLWTACGGAILGYIPNICEMIRNKIADKSFWIYGIVLIIGIISFFWWKSIDTKSSTLSDNLTDLIADELSEERVPTNQLKNYSYNNVTGNESKNNEINNVIISE